MLANGLSMALCCRAWCRVDTAEFRRISSSERRSGWCSGQQTPRCDDSAVVMLLPSPVLSGTRLRWLWCPWRGSSCQSRGPTDIVTAFCPHVSWSLLAPDQSFWHLYWYCRSNQALAWSYLLAPRPQNLILLPRAALGCGDAFFPVAALSEPPGMFWNKPQNFSSKPSVFSRSCCGSASSAFRKAPRSGRAASSSSDFWGTWALMRLCWSCCRSLMKRFGFCTTLALPHVILTVF